MVITIPHVPSPRWLAFILPPLLQLPSVAGPTWKQRFEGLKTATVTGHHLVYFSENNPLSQFFITADNETPALFDRHILEHEDGGTMQIIRVLPASSGGPAKVSITSGGGR
jgi:hypothetical protein